MSNKTKAAILLAIFVGSSSTALAAGHSARHLHRSYAGAPANRVEPPRMIEIRPGLWVGSYQCITDLERGGRDCSSF